MKENIHENLPQVEHEHYSECCLDFGKEKVAAEAATELRQGLLIRVLIIFSVIGVVWREVPLRV